MDAIVLLHGTCDAWLRRVSPGVHGAHLCQIDGARSESGRFLAKWGQLNREAGPGAATMTCYAAVINRSEGVLILDKVPCDDVSYAWCYVMTNEGRECRQELYQKNKN